MRSPQFQQAFASVADGGTVVLTALDEASDGELGYCVNAAQDACLADPDYLARNAQLRPSMSSARIS